MLYTQKPHRSYTRSFCRSYLRSKFLFVLFTVISVVLCVYARVRFYRFYYKSKVWSKKLAKLSRFGLHKKRASGPLRTALPAEDKSPSQLSLPERFNNRKKLLSKFCKRTNYFNEFNNATLAQDTIIINDLNFTLCSPENTANSFYFSNGSSKHHFDEDENPQNIANHYLSNDKSSNFTKILTVRHPIERLISTYKKFCTEGTSYGRSIKTEYFDRIARFVCIQKVYNEEIGLGNCTVGSDAFEIFKYGLGERVDSDVVSPTLPSRDDLDGWNEPPISHFWISLNNLSIYLFNQVSRSATLYLSWGNYIQVYPLT